MEPPFGDRSAVTGLEIALSETTAQQLAVELGDRLFIGPAGARAATLAAAEQATRRLHPVLVIGKVVRRAGELLALRGGVGRIGDLLSDTTHSKRAV